MGGEGECLNNDRIFQETPREGALEQPDEGVCELQREKRSNTGETPERSASLIAEWKCVSLVMTKHWKPCVCAQKRLSFGRGTPAADKPD